MTLPEPDNSPLQPRTSELNSQALCVVKTLTGRVNDCTAVRPFAPTVALSNTHDSMELLFTFTLIITFYFSLITFYYLLFTIYFLLFTIYFLLSLFTFDF